MKRNLKIEYRKTSDLIPYANNSRTHSEEQVAQIAASIREFGFTNPLLIDEANGIIAGHGRLMAARKLGMEDVPCIVIAGLTEAQKKALVIADNKLALNADWDEEMLAAEIERLIELDYDVSLLGFDDDELERLVAKELEQVEGLTDPDEVPEVQETPVSKPGDIWLLGEHRLMCGDSTNKMDIEALLNGNSYDVCVIDPPYELESLYFETIPNCLPGKKLIVFWDMKRFAAASVAAVKHGWNPLYELVWDNVTSWYTPNRPLARHKACGIFGDDPFWDFDKAIIKDGKKREQKVVRNTRGECNYVPLDGAVHLRSIEAFPTTRESGGHEHSKPVEWIKAIFNGLGGENYLDLFGGSGTTIIACEQTRRRSFVMEKDPKYVDVAVRRWQQFTGKQAVRESDGKTFDEVANE